MARFNWRGRERADGRPPRKSTRRADWYKMFNIELTGEERAWLQAIVGACSGGLIDVAHPDVAKRVLTKLSASKPR